MAMSSSLLVSQIDDAGELLALEVLEGGPTAGGDVADLVAAANFLRARDQAPSMLIGHSLGGAAVLAAAGHAQQPPLAGERRSLARDLEGGRVEGRHLDRRVAPEDDHPHAVLAPAMPLDGRVVALIFEKSSTRTRTSFEVAAYDQGANVTYLGPSGSQIGHNASMKDTARVLGRMYDGIEYRGFAQETVEILGGSVFTSQLWLIGFGVVIVSTSQGIMTGQQARKSQLGGEVLAYIW